MRALLHLYGEEVLVSETEERAVAAVGRAVFQSEDGENIKPDRGLEMALERQGLFPVELMSDCLFDFASEATHLLTVTPPGPLGFCSEAHRIACFLADGVPALREAGYQVQVDASFPLRAPESAPHYWTALEPRGDDDLWFALRLGVLLDGRSYNLVPALLELLNRAGEAASIEELAHFPGRYRAVPLGGGAYVPVPWERLQSILQVLIELQEQANERTKERFWEALLIPKTSLGALADLDDALRSEASVVEWRAGAEWLTWARSFRRGPGFSPLPVGLRATLRPYQHQGLMWLEFLRDHGAGGVLADDMGLGKTLQVLALLCREKEARSMDRPSLIVAPKSLLGNWAQEAKKFAPHLRIALHSGPLRLQNWPRALKADVIVASYSSLIRDSELLAKTAYHYAIVDEAQAIKNHQSLAHAAVCSLDARHRLGLSGTPVENHLGELWSLFEFVMPSLLGSEASFRRRFQEPIEARRDETAAQKLRETVAPYILRRTKEAVARDLPSKTELVRSIELSGAQRDLYESVRLHVDQEVRAAVRARGIGGSSMIILDALTKLRQVCCDPLLLPLETARGVEESAKRDHFIDLVVRQVETGHRVLVFSQFARMLELLRSSLNKAGIPSLLLTGKTENRTQLVQAFEAGEAPVFLISLKAGGTGLNLVSADVVIHYDPWWNAAAQAQATDRAYRIGQKRPVFVYRLIAQGTVEERMLALQEKKASLAASLFGTPGAETVRNEDIDLLFAPLEETPASESSFPSDG